VSTRSSASPDSYSESSRCRPATPTAPPLDQTLPSYHDDRVTRHLMIAFISVAGFTGPRDLARCRYYPDDDAAFPPLTIAVPDAAAPDLSEVEPPPAVSYRLE